MTFPLLTVVIFNALIFTAEAQTAFFVENACVQVVRVPVVITENVPNIDNLKFDLERAELQIPLQAINQVLGVRVRSSAKADVIVNNATIQTHYQQRTSSLSAGVARYSIVEKITEVGVAGTKFTIKANAEVCIPADPRALAETLCLADIQTTRNNATFDLVMNALSNLKFFKFSNEPQFCDILVTVDIHNVSISTTSQRVADDMGVIDLIKVVAGATVMAEIPGGEGVVVTASDFYYVRKSSDPHDIHIKTLELQLKLLNHISAEVEKRLMSSIGYTSDRFQNFFKGQLEGGAIKW